MSNIQEIHTIIQLVPGAVEDWDSTILPVPDGLYVYDSISKKIKIGDDVHTFDELDVWLDVDYIENFQVDLSALEKEVPENTDIDKVVIAKNVGNNVMKYSISDTYLHNDILTPIENILAIEDTQNNELDNIQLKADEITNITASDINKIVYIKSNKLAIYNKTYDDNKNDIISKVVNLNKLHINSINFYLDSNCFYEVKALNNNTTYYAKINAIDDDGNSITYDLICDDDTDINISKINDNIFSIVINDIDQEKSVSFTAICNNGYGDKKKVIEIDVFGFEAIINRGDSQDVRSYNAVIDDKENSRYIAVGYGSDQSNNSLYGLITIFSYNFDPIYDLKYTNSSFDTVVFNNCKIDQDGYAIIVGYVQNGVDSSKGLILKMKDMAIIHSKYYYTENNISTKFNDIVITSINSYVIVGYSGTLITHQEAVIVHFSSIFNIFSSNFVGNQNKNSIFYSVDIDNEGNYIAAGITNNHGNINGFIAKFNLNLELINNSILGNLIYTYFKKIKCDNNGNYVIIGYNSNDGNAKNAGIIFKLDKNLNIIPNSKYVISNTLKNELTGIDIDSNGNYLICGNAEDDNGINSGFYMVLGNDFSIIKEKILTSSNNNFNMINDIIYNSTQNYVLVGNIANQAISSDLILLASSSIINEVYSFNLIDLTIDNGSSYLTDYGTVTVNTDANAESYDINDTAFSGSLSNTIDRPETVDAIY